MNHTNVIQINFTFVFYALSKRFVWIIHIPNNNICFISKLPRDRKPACDITEILLMKRGMKHHKTKPSHIPYLKENPSNIPWMVLYFYEVLLILLCWSEIKDGRHWSKKKWTAANRKILKCLLRNHPSIWMKTIHNWPLYGKQIL